MIKHVLTENQAYRLGIPSLVGSEVQVILYEKHEKHEKPTELANVPIARDVFLQWSPHWRQSQSRRIIKIKEIINE